MTRRRLPLLLLTMPLLGTVAFQSAMADTDWPQVRGPQRNGIATVPRTTEPGTAGVRIADRWSAEGPRVVWRRSIGAGFSSVAVVGNRLLTLAADGEREHVVCLDTTSGDTLWSTPIGNMFTNNFGDGPRATPTVDGDRVFAVSGDAQLAAVDLSDGSTVWQRDLPADFGGEVPRFGFSASPLVEGDRLILEVGGGEGKPAVVALDKATGEIVWGALEGDAGYASPVVATLDGVRQYLLSRRTGQEIVSLDTDGAVLWRHPGARAAIVLPMVVDDHRVFLSSSDDDYGGVMLAVSREESAAGESASGDTTWSVEEAWTNRRFRNHFNNAVIVGGHLYGFDNATLRTVDLENGSLGWAQRGFGKGSLIAAGDRLFVLGDDGALALVSADPDRYVERGRTQATTGRAWTAPALARDVLYVRDQDEIVALGVGSRSGTDEASREIVSRHLASRGGGEAWKQVETMALEGVYAAFSQRNPFTLVRARPDLFRLDFTMLGQAAIRAKDQEGLWMLHPLMRMEAPQRTDSGPLTAQLAREAYFGPILLEAEARGLTISARGAGELDGRATVVLEVGFPSDATGNGAAETWHLDAETHREVMIESQVHDFTQSAEPITQRTYFDDFRTVDGLVIPHRVELEFGARLEVIEVESVTINGTIDLARFAFPATESDPE